MRRRPAGRAELVAAVADAEREPPVAQDRDAPVVQRAVAPVGDGAVDALSPHTRAVAVAARESES